MTPTKAAKEIFPTSTFLSDLPANVLPQSLSSPSNSGPPRGRLVIIGDVHGMRKSLEALLDKVAFDRCKGDHLIFVGDLVNKGPDSPGVVDLAMKLGASAVRGNHEDAVLSAAVEMNSSGYNPPNPGDLSAGAALSESPQHDLPVNDVQDSQASEKSISATAEKSRRPSPATQITASALSPSHLEWLAALPFILRIKLSQKLISSLGDTLIVVHAGLVPGIPLEEQDPHAVLHTRSLVRTNGKDDVFTPMESSGDEGWVVEWDRWQDKLPSKTTVIFGHDAKRRIQIGRYSIGLDSACVYGHRLSALVISASEGKIAHEVIQVDCADVPVAPTVSVKEEAKPVLG
jgi:hypothetical protein